jgi:hypothetical protein
MNLAWPAHTLSYSPPFPLFVFANATDDDKQCLSQMNYSSCRNQAGTATFCRIRCLHEIERYARAKLSHLRSCLQALNHSVIRAGPPDTPVSFSPSAFPPSVSPSTPALGMRMRMSFSRLQAPTMSSSDAVDRIMGAGEVPARPTTFDLSVWLCRPKEQDLDLFFPSSTPTNPMQKRPGRYETMWGMASTGAWNECAVGLVPMHARLTNNFAAFFAPPAVTCST